MRRRRKRNLIMGDLLTDILEGLFELVLESIFEIICEICFERLAEIPSLINGCAQKLSHPWEISFFDEITKLDLFE